MEKPNKLYHGSSLKIEGPLKPILQHTTLDHVHAKPAVFGTERADIATLFMFSASTLSSIGYEQNIAYICIWGTPDEFKAKDKGGFLYTLPSKTFEKVGKEYEWQSFTEVAPEKAEEFHFVIDGMMEKDVQVYFINDESIFDKIVEDKNNRAPILKNLISENQKYNKNIKVFKK